MLKSKKFQLSSIRTFLSKYPGFSNPEKYSLSFLNISQFTGALNDNIYKLVLIFYLIQIKGPSEANAILSTAGAIFVIPFLLFSSFAGILADRYSKNRIIITLKATEIFIMFLAMLAFAFRLEWSSYILLFLLSMQSAFFSPSKYGILPELVPKHRVSKANGLITSFTYLAIIIGTFLASFLTEQTHNNYVLIGGICLFFAATGFVCSYGVKHTPPNGTKERATVFFLREIWKTLVKSASQKHLLISISASSYFLFIGAFMQLNIIPFAMQSMGYSEVAGGYLFLTTALGIATGSVVAGRMSKKRIELGVTCLSGIMISLFFFILSFSASSLTLTIISLFGIGYFGGGFIVPADAFIQLFSPEENRGKVIAASNFSSFVGVLMASFALFLFNQLFGFTAAQSFIIVGCMTILFTLFLMIRLSDLLLSYVARKFLYLFFPVKTENLKALFKANNPVIMLEEGSALKAWLLCGVLPNLNILVPQYRKRRFPFFERFFFSMHRISSPEKFEELIKKSKQFRNHDCIPCIYLRKKKPIPEAETFSILSVFKRKHFEVVSVHFRKENGSRMSTIVFSK